MMHKKSLKKTEGLLLTGVFWDPADTHIFPVLLSGLACSSLSVSAFFAPPGPHPDEVCFFVPEEQMEKLMRFCRRLRQQTGSPMQIRITGKTLLEGDGWDLEKVQNVFLDDTDSRMLLYLGNGSFIACCDSWDAQAVLEAIQEEE